MADFQKNKRHQRNGDQAEKGHEVNPFIRKNLPEVHAGKKHTRNNHTGRANHASDRMKRIVDQRRKPDASEKKKNSDENRNNIEVQNNLLPVIGSLTADHLFAVRPEKDKLYAHINTAVKHPFRSGNFIGVLVLRAGVAGVAYPSLIARTFSAVMITVLCFQRKNEVFYRCKWIFRWNVDFMKQILKIAIPNGMENGIFQLVKVALSGIVALFGTYQIAANGVAQSIWSLAALAGVAMGPVFITVIGQCMGNGDADAAEHYFKRLTRITLLISSAWNLLIFLLTPFFMKFYALQPETKRLVIWLVLIHNVFNAAAYPFSGALSNGLRAAGDVKFTMYVSVISTIAVRLLLSWLLGIVLKMGVIGIAIAMVCDWSIRAVIFFWRQKSGKWNTFQVI